MNRFYRFAHPLVLAGLLLAGAGCSLFRRHRDEPPPAAATPPPPPAPLPATAARDLAAIMGEVLQLRPDQVTRVRDILNGTVTQVNAARQQYPAQSPALTSALTRINRSSDAQLRQVLGPAKYKEMGAKKAQIQAELQRK